MTLNDKTKALLEGLAAEQNVDWHSLSDETHPVHVAKGLDAIRRWLGIPGTTGGLRPSAELLGAVLGYGREGALRICEEFVAQTARTDDEAKVTLSALAIVAGRARAMRLIGWDLTGVTVEAAKGKPKLLVVLPDDVNDRMRAAAAARGESFNTFVTESVRDRLARIERPLRRAGTRARPAV